MQGYEHLKGSDQARGALNELESAGRRAAEAYAATERAVRDHKVQAALSQLRLDHERHVRELSTILAEVGDGASAWAGEAPGAPVAEEMTEGALTPQTVLAAVKRAELEIRDAYARHVERGYPEPLRAALMRHLREEEAHLEWLDESRWWHADES